ncbi:MAG: tripartite tricarboxylate transporter substrate-binding protein, partial [Burkholderiales bacterium]
SAVLAGDVAYAIVALNSALAFGRAGTLKLVALTSEKRSALAPGVPALPELGINGVDGAVRAGLAGPAGLPAAIVAKLNVDVNRVLQEPQTRERFASLGMEPLGTTPEEYDAYNKRTMAQVQRVVAQANIKVE